MVCAKLGHERVVSMLLENGANVLQQNNEGKTSFALATKDSIKA
jgi:ankyrin repeat protein